MSDRAAESALDDVVKDFLRVWDVKREPADGGAGISIGTAKVPEDAPRTEWSLLDAVARLRRAVDGR